MPRNRPKFWITASVLRGKLFESLEICWMSDKTVIEFNLVLCQELCWSRRLVSSICIIPHFIRKPNSIIATVRLHEPRHLEEDYPITRFFFWKQKIPKFLCKRTNKIQGSTLQTGENIKTVWTYLTSQGAALKFMHVIAPFAKKKIGESSVFKKGCDWITFFRVPRFE